MKTKISIDIRKDGNALYKIIKLIAGHNSGIANVTKSDIIGVLVAEKIDYPSLNKNSFTSDETGSNGNLLHISDDNGETFYVTLEWKRIEELANISEQDLVTVKS